jgi:predicted lipoprotein with Yx(FWY)xxD motif
MKRWLFVLLPVLAMSSFLMAPRISAQDDASLKVAQDPTVGAFLTDAKGMTVYLFTKDTTKGQSSCSGDCATSWPPVAAADGMKLPAGVPGTLGSIDRDDGSKQATYNDIPLYYFAKDAKAGDIAGQEIGGVWFVVAPGAALGPYPTAPGEGTPFPASTLKVGFTDDLDPFLTDDKGMTLYLFTKDTEAGKSVCNGDCAMSWPALAVSTELLLPPGIQGKLTAITRDDGSMQVAYDDIPLYHFAKDTKAGDTNGQEVGDVWYIVTPGMKLGDPLHEAEATGTPDTGY